MQDFQSYKINHAARTAEVRVIILFCFLLISLNLFSQQLQIGIMRAYSVSGLTFTYGDGEYEFRSDSTTICEMTKMDKISLSRNGSGVRIYKNEISLGTYSSIYIREKKSNQFLNIQCVSPASKTVRKYMNDFIVQPDGQDKLKVINEVEMENYLAGVIESEGGGGKHPEYYKVQAVLSRTYALDHLFKHNKDGFQLCDEVHCQAYLNMMRFTPSIKKAVQETHGIVMVSADYKLADGFFFANCGGQTSPADFVWNTNVSYCKSVRDTFCIKSKQANWKKEFLF
ncbi:MAG: SpoIID/LytB domain-containing protein [Crocinitomicaceae bacterium]|nr:SpoIID/LytB domain-containing protein [Crocinitomicaceae bacterium]